MKVMSCSSLQIGAAASDVAVLAGRWRLAEPDLSAWPVEFEDLEAARLRLRPFLSPSPLRTYPALDGAVGSGIRGLQADVGERRLVAGPEGADARHAGESTAQRVRSCGVALAPGR